MNKKLDVLAAGYAGAIVSGIVMLVLGIAGNLGVYTGAVEMMEMWHEFFSLSTAGIIGGVIEGAVFGFIFGYLLTATYNKLLK